jgi:predicted permease
MNLASMLLVRGVARRREFAIRLALGAGRARLIRQLVTESVLLAIAAGVAGVVLTIWLLQLLLASLPPLPEGLRLALDVRVDWRVLAYAMVFATMTGILFGLVPALQASKPDVSSSLKHDSGAVTAGYRRSRGRRALIVLQVACSLLLLISAGLVLRSLDKVRPTNLGFSSTNTLIVPLALDEARYDRAASQEFYRQVSERAATLPGVQKVTLAEEIPGGFLSRTRRGTEIEGYQGADRDSLEIDSTYVGPGYFTNLDVPIVWGREFVRGDTEGAPCVAIINEAFARRYFGGVENTGGRRLARYVEGRKPSREMCDIVGVVRDDRFQSLNTSIRPFFFLPVLQGDRSRMSLLIHTNGEPGELARAARRVVLSLDPAMPLTGIQTLNEYFDAGAYPFRLLGIIMAASGVMALLLAIIGIYGLVAYSIAQRTREVGIRVALGASRAGVLKMVIGQGMTLVVWGLCLGLLLSYALTRVLTSAAFEAELLIGVSPTDSLTFAGVTLLLALVALAACWIPARRAAAINPLEALRHE